MVGVGLDEVLARGVAGGEGGLELGFLKDGGGGGMAFLSRSAFVTTCTGLETFAWEGSGSSSLDMVGGAPLCFLATSWMAGFRRHARNGHGRWR